MFEAQALFNLAAMQQSGPLDANVESNSNGAHLVAQALPASFRASSSGGEHPAVDALPPLDAGILEQVRKLGHYPRERNNPKNAEEAEERKLAQKIRKKRSALLSTTRDKLKAMQDEEVDKSTKIGAERQDSKIEAMMAQVRELGTWPRQHAPSKDPKREAERLLAQRIAKMKAAACLPPAVLAELEAMEAEHNESLKRIESELQESKVQALMAEVRKFGGWPLQHAPSQDPKREAERLLAQKIAKMKTAACLPPAVVKELDALEAAHRHSQENLEAEQRDSQMENMIAQVQDLGRWPLLRRAPRSSKHQAEHQLARRVRAALRIGPLSKANAALLDEMHWVHRREQEANQMDRRKRRLLTRRQQAHCAALARAARLRSLLRQLGHSTKRCTCHDFDCWAPLWKIDASLALDLRARGFHFYDCALAPYDCQREFGTSRGQCIIHSQDHLSFFLMRSRSVRLIGIREATGTVGRAVMKQLARKMEVRRRLGHTVRTIQTRRKKLIRRVVTSMARGFQYLILCLRERVVALFSTLPPQVA